MEDEFKRWIEIGNRRGNATFFAAETREEKQIVELSAVNEWVKAANAVWDYGLSGARLNPKDPPDCFVARGGKEISVEVTELVDGEFFKKRDQAKKRSEKYSPHFGKGFQDTQWDLQKFQDALLKRVSAKDRSYLKQGVEIDVLVVATGENWLYPDKVKQWLSSINFERQLSLNSIFLLMKYSPSYSQQHWPIFKIYGEP